ncbi:hypothetical protein FSPOR_4132 [Fusarium sporotrichioides]|uniref:Uncharacterized protein n=1 Tax=Fusarium sporotrichioides TaxID=5514 RepID=A0A395SDU1_FUSSP|nr:hypothetical protein FSPOR_4132 [Fusarium sporotrichioides]
MHLTTILMHVVIGLATMAWCRTRFTSPPNWNWDEIEGGDKTKNKRVEPGHTLKITWETDLQVAILEIYQLGASKLGSQVISIETTSTEGVGLTYWDAEYDLFGAAVNNEDSVYWFVLRKTKIEQVAQSHDVNVSAPVTTDTTSISVTTASTFLQQRSSSTAESVSAAPTTISSSVGADTGLSRGETAGVTAGSILGGLLILSGLGWLAWRRIARGKLDTEGLQSQQQQLSFSETKAELPGDVFTHPSEYARSQPGLHEAP